MSPDRLKRLLNIADFRRAGDEASADLLQRIYQAEIGHVAAGMRWFHHFATRAGLVPFTLSGKPLEQFAQLAGVALPVTVRFGGAEFSTLEVRVREHRPGGAALRRRGWRLQRQHLLLLPLL